MSTRETDRVSEAYAGTFASKVFQRHLRARLHWTCRQVQGPRVLDVGCSQGIVSILLGREGFEVVGLDIEPSAIETAQAALAEEAGGVRSRVWFVHGDVLTAELDSAGFDTIILGEVLEHLVQPARFVQRCHELLTEEGVLIVTVPFGTHPHPDHKTTFYLANLLQTLGDGFRPEAMELIHTFTGSGTPVPILGLVARKTGEGQVADAATRRWLEFSDRAFAAAEQRYLALIEFFETERTNLTDQVSKHKATQSDLIAKEQDARKQLTALQQEREQSEQTWQRRVEAAEHARVQADQVWQAQLAEADQQMAALALEWQQKLAETEQARAEAEQQAATKATEWQTRLTEAEQTMAALALEWQQKLTEAEQARAEAEQQAAEETGEWQARLAEAEQTMAALAQEWLQKLEVADQKQAQVVAECDALLAAAERERLSLKQEFDARLLAAIQESGRREEESGRHLRAAERKHEVATQKLEARLAAVQQEHAAREQAHQARLAELTKAQRNSTALLAETVQALLAIAQEVQALTEERNLLRQDLRDASLVEQQLRHGGRERDQVIRQLARRVAMMEDATSYRIGLSIVRAAQRPYLLPLLPFRVFRILFAGWQRRKRNKKEKPPSRLAPLPREVSPPPDPARRRSPITPTAAHLSARVQEAMHNLTATGVPSPAPAGPVSPKPAAPAPAPAVPAPRPAPPAPRAEQPGVVAVRTPAIQLPPPPSLELPPAPVRGLNLHVGAILDEFSWLCYQYECNLMKLTPEGWRDLFAAQRPDFLFVESASRGNHNEWGRVMVYRTRTPVEPLIDVVQWCREHNIPTVFWNKEDPVSCDYYMEAARLFDFIFTTDAACIPHYREALGHERVYGLQFAAQPMLHNPTPVKGGRRYDVAFAGSWYVDGNPERYNGAETVLRPALRHGLHIYDRNFHRTVQSELYEWPEEFRSHVVGGVPYEQLLAVYRQYKAFLNINFVADSPTMFARRVFELLACGTPVISAYSRGIEETLGSDAVLLSRSAEQTDEYLTRLLGDDAFRDEVTDRGLRAVMSAHTCGHRLQEIVNRMGQAGAAVAPLVRTRAEGEPAKAEEPRPVSIPPRAPGLCLPPPPKFVPPGEMVRRPELVVGAIMDDMFEPCWRHECHLVQFTPDNWKEVLTREKPEFLFIDSAWRGNGGAWFSHLQRVVHGQSQPPSEAFQQLIEWSRKQRIPTVFWNREDPPSYHHFIGAAKLCDYVFTTDSDCLPRYREDCQHDRVNVLPFAAQPWVHNPISAPYGRTYDLSFAGTWYAIKHPKRVVQMETILRPALAYGVHIYDRMLYFWKTNSYIYPEDYRPHIVGSLSYEETLAVMKLYRIILNVNSVIDSPTMCSCRIFEGLMAGAAVISGYARGIENLLGRDLVPLPETSEETASWIETFLNDEPLRQRTVHLAQRKILEQHTYSQRLDQALTALGRTEHVLGTKTPLISVLAVTETREQIARVLANFERQTYPAKELTLVLRAGSEHLAWAQSQAAAMAPAHLRVVTMPAGSSLGEGLELALRNSMGSYVSIMAAEHHYGARFLSDLMLPLAYVQAGIIGKRAHYSYAEGSDALNLCLAGQEHQYVEAVAPSAMVIARPLLDKVPISQLDSANCDAFFVQCRTAGARIYAADRYHYAAVLPARSASPRWPPVDSHLQTATLVGRGLALGPIDI